MAKDTILNAKDFVFAPFTPDVGGDSGALSFATLKSDVSVQYVVKSGYSEIACNEFMYHHVAAALGLYTQEARLFTGIPNTRYAIGIRYVPNARKFILEEAAACFHTPTHSLGLAFYGAAAIAYDRVGVNEKPEIYDQIAAEECAKMEAALRAIAVENEPNPAKINWNC